MTMPCAKCGGRGQVITDPCKGCRGDGVIKEKQRIKVHIPAGVDSGMRLKMSGYGDAGVSGGPPGDLYVFINVESHELFEREGNDVYITLPISFAEAALGCKKEVPSPTGEHYNVTIPESTQTGTILLIKGAGFRDVHSQSSAFGREVKGDLKVKVAIETPTKLTAEQRQFFQKLKELETPLNMPKSKGFLDKIKKLFS